LRLFLYCWASPNTLIGLIVAFPDVLLGRGRLVDGVLEFEGPWLRFFLTRCTFLQGGATAMALGHVVIGLSPTALDLTRKHERVHVRQYERWGPLMLPIYLGSSLLCWLQGKRAYRDNIFEREAYDIAG
jgi:hypothetical protein